MYVTTRTICEIGTAMGSSSGAGRARRALRVAAERRQREDEPVEVVADVEVAREARARELGLVPVAVLALGARQPGDGALDGRRTLAAGGEQREQRPAGLRGGRAAAPALGAILVGGERLAEAAVRVLHALEPGDRTADRRGAERLARTRQRRQGGARPVEVVRAPAPEPGAVRLLRPEQPVPRAACLGIAGATVEREHLEHVGGDVRARRIDHLAEVAERELAAETAGVVGVEGGEAAVPALHAERPAQRAPQRGLELALALGPVDRAKRQDHLGGVVDVRVVVVLELEREAARLE